MMREKYIFLLLTTALIASYTGLAGKAADTISLSGSPSGALRPSVSSERDQKAQGSRLEGC